MKPTYEELERQCDELLTQRDDAIAQRDDQAKVIQDLQYELHVTRERLRALEYFVKQADIR